MGSRHLSAVGMFLWLGLAAAGEPNAAGVELESARAELARIEQQQADLTVRIAAADAEQTRLGRSVTELKQNRAGLPQVLLNVRLERALRSLRDRLLESQELRRRQQRLIGQANVARGRVRAALRAGAQDALAEAERLFRAGREAEADGMYRQALDRLEEEQRLASPAPQPEVEPEPFEPAVTGREGPAELRALAAVLRHEAAGEQQQLERAEQTAAQRRADLELEQRASRFQGIRGRDAAAAAVPDVGREADLGRELEALLRRADTKRGQIRHLLNRAAELERAAADTERRLLEGKPR